VEKYVGLEVSFSTSGFFFASKMWPSYISYWYLVLDLSDCSAL